MPVTHVPSNPEQEHWDVLVIGTGMGGAVTGYELARRGRRVLFLEKGLLRHVDDSEAAPPADPGLLDSVESRLAAGWWPTKLTANTSFGRAEFYAPLGCGSGGSTAFYAGALERFFPSDFAPRGNFANVGESTVPDSWPITYGALSPFYSRAESLFRVCGTQDPLNANDNSLREPPRLSSRDEHFLESFTRLGLHPYRIHAGYEFIEGCTGCSTSHCRFRCKQDAAWACLIPALESHGAKILPACEVTRIDAGVSRVEGVQCRYQGRMITLRAPLVILAAGAYSTPVLLLNSHSVEWPEGLANRSGYVGRNLMFHATDFFAVAPLQQRSAQGPQKTLAVNDFYVSEHGKLGTFQTIGAAADIGQIMQYIRDVAQRETTWWKRLAKAEPRWWGKLTSPVVRAIALAAYYGLNFRHAAIWAGITEDLPYFDNRVVADKSTPSGFRVEYRYRDELKNRTSVLRDRIKRALGPHRVMALSGENNLNYGHVCGTCRFGTDPNTSVLDSTNRAHGIDNLYVTDASFFPSSGGTNPSLTIAANALRVASCIDAQSA